LGFGCLYGFSFIFSSRFFCFGDWLYFRFFGLRSISLYSCVCCRLYGVFLRLNFVFLRFTDFLVFWLLPLRCLSYRILDSLFWFPRTSPTSSCSFLSRLGIFEHQFVEVNQLDNAHFRIIAKSISCFNNSGVSARTTSHFLGYFSK